MNPIRWSQPRPLAFTAKPILNKTEFTHPDTIWEVYSKTSLQPKQRYEILLEKYPEVLY